ncbi:hypothetical protein F2Q69_00027281 [Brassica cretica]|uniref:Uncharacterized protein n=1 Tax=Brassica cretica TaxID=69181 RepID=A0A8S9S986_BRACR|nr:hypothetical protein F2Q69_00027281 [Brassica cretica]
MFSEFELPLGFEDCRTGPPRKPRAGRDASWNKLERELEQAGTRAGTSWNAIWNELERMRVEARAGTERERLRAGADRMNTNACKNRLGFGLGFQIKSACTVSVREGTSMVRSPNGLN